MALHGLFRQTAVPVQPAVDVRADDAGAAAVEDFRFTGAAALEGPEEGTAGTSEINRGALEGEASETSSLMLAGASEGRAPSAELRRSRTAATAPAAAVASSHQGKIKARLLVPEMPSQTLPDTGSV